MFYLNTIKQLLLFVEQLYQLEVYLIVDFLLEYQHCRYSKIQGGMQIKHLYLWVCNIIFFGGKGISKFIFNILVM